MANAAKAAIIFIVGPTAAGKTRLAVKLARKIGGEIISADSMQVYRGMRVLSQAPSRAQKEKIRYHLAEALDPRKEYSAAVFQKKCSRLIEPIIKRKRMPVVVGGSGLYVKALIDGLFPSPPEDAVFRKKMHGLAGLRGSAYLYKKLKEIDPGSAGRIHPNDARRIIRALEIYRTAGKTMTALKSETHGLKNEYRIKIFGFTMPRERLYARIDTRVDEMFNEGILAEVERLRRKRLSRTARAALGLKEINGYLEGQYDLDTAKELLKRNTRRFAKRQLTWFRADKRIRWFDMSKLSDNEIIKKIVYQSAGLPVNRFKTEKKDNRQTGKPANRQN